MKNYVTAKVTNWTAAVQKLSSFAVNEPQATYTALTRSLACEWHFLQRVIPHIGEYFQPLEDTLAGEFIPALIGQPTSLTNDDRKLFSLPTSFAGLGITNPVENAEHAFQTSRRATETLVKNITKKTGRFDTADHRMTVQEATTQHRVQAQERHSRAFEELIESASPQIQRALKRIRTFKTSAWLNVTPSQELQFDLSPMEFRDGLTVRYQLPLLDLPNTCDGCGESLDLRHALECKKGGLITRRHNEVRDVFAFLFALVWSGVDKEPMVRSPDPRIEGDKGLRADIMARGVWSTQRTALFDTRVTDSDAASYVNRSISNHLRLEEHCKVQKYKFDCRRRRVDFTPLVLTADGSYAFQTLRLVRLLGSKLAQRWSQHYSTTMSWLRTRLSLALVRAVSHCIRGSRNPVKAYSTKEMRLPDDGIEVSSAVASLTEVDASDHC